MNNLEWRCHICNRLRPDDRISVYSRIVTVQGISITENVRHCNDNPECVEGAKEKSWVKLVTYTQLNQRVEFIEPSLITRFKWRADRRCEYLNAQLKVPYYRWEVHDWLDGRWAVLAMQNKAQSIKELDDVRGESG